MKVDKLSYFVFLFSRILHCTISYFRYLYSVLGDPCTLYTNITNITKYEIHHCHNVIGHTVCMNLALHRASVCASVFFLLLLFQLHPDPRRTRNCRNFIIFFSRQFVSERWKQNEKRPTCWKEARALHVVKILVDSNEVTISNQKQGHTEKVESSESVFVCTNKNRLVCV